MKTVILCLALLSSVTFAAEKVLVSGHVEQASELLAGVDYRVTYDDATGKLLLRMMGSMLSSPSPIIYQAMGVLDDAGNAVNGYVGNCGHEPGPDDVLMDLADDGWYQFEINASDYSGNFGMFLVVVIRKDDAANYEAWFGVTNMTVPNDWDNYDWSWENRIKFSTGPVVTAIMVRPKGFPAGATLPDPPTIAAGAIESDAHQADVEIQVTPAEAGLSVSVSLVNGKGATTAKDAKLVTNSGTATGGGEAKTMVTGAGGKITGTLTSSDVLTTCTIRAGSLERTVAFTWDEYEEEGQWTFTPEYLPVPGILTNTLVLRHHRYGDKAAEPSQPLDRHTVRFYVEKVEYLVDGELQADYNTPDAPKDLSRWARFLAPGENPDDPVGPEAPPTPEYLTDATGCVTARLQVRDHRNLQSVTMVAYDWTVWKEDIPPPPAAAAPQRADPPPNDARKRKASTKTGASTPDFTLNATPTELCLCKAATVEITANAKATLEIISETTKKVIHTTTLKADQAYTWKVEQTLATGYYLLKATRLGKKAEKTVRIYLNAERVTGTSFELDVPPRGPGNPAEELLKLTDRCGNVLLLAWSGAAYVMSYTGAGMEKVDIGDCRWYGGRNLWVVERTTYLADWPPAQGPPCLYTGGHWYNWDNKADGSADDEGVKGKFDFWYFTWKLKAATGKLEKSATHYYSDKMLATLEGHVYNSNEPCQVWKVKEKK